MKEGVALSDTPFYSFFFLGPFIVCVQLSWEIEARACDKKLVLKTKLRIEVRNFLRQAKNQCLS